MGLVTHNRPPMNLSVLTKDFHNLEEGWDLFYMSLFIDIYYIVQGQYTCTNAWNFVEELTKLNLDGHEKYWNSIVEI